MVFIFLFLLSFQPPVADVYVICRKFHIVRRTGEMLSKFLRTETPLGRDIATQMDFWHLIEGIGIISMNGKVVISRQSKNILT